MRTGSLFFGSSPNLREYEQVLLKSAVELQRAFKIELSKGDVDFDEINFYNDLRGDTVKTRLVVKKNSIKEEFTEQRPIQKSERRGAEIHRLIKKNAYILLKNLLKSPGVPYGIMDGVRPTKIVHRWLREGFGVTSQGVIDRDKISRKLREDYLTSYEKAELLTEVAIRQLPICGKDDPKKISIYVGIPFCRTRCLYCSFPSNVLPEEEKISEFMEVLNRDIDSAAEEIRRYGFKVQTIYIGGGTPTALPENFFAEMLEKVFSAFYDGGVEEFTVECGRPDTITAEKISVMKKFNVTRVSVNPQTMKQETLDRIGRQHSIEDITKIFGELRTAGDWKINMDLILGLPGENIDDFKNTLNKVLELSPDDITLHALALKRGSDLQMKLADEIENIDDLNLPPDEEVRAMADYAEKILRKKNYLPYYLYRQGNISGQIENIGWCKPGAEGIYNIQIMGERQTILGVGGAAATKVADLKENRLRTSFNAKDLATYLRDIEQYTKKRAEVLAEVYEPVEETEIQKLVSRINSPAKIDTPTEEKFNENKVEKVEEFPQLEVPAIEETFSEEIPPEEIFQADPVEEVATEKFSQKESSAEVKDVKHGKNKKFRKHKKNAAKKSDSDK